MYYLKMKPWSPGSQLPRRFHLSGSGLSLISPSWPVSIVPVKHRFYFSGSGLLLITADSSAPVNQKPQIFFLKLASLNHKCHPIALSPPHYFDNFYLEICFPILVIFTYLFLSFTYTFFSTMESKMICICFFETF